MDNCIFCKIIRGELSSYKIYEDDKFLAILDLFPNTKGMTLVITKEHYPSYAFDMSDELYQEFMLAAKRIGKILDEKLGVKRTAIVMEGMGINHAHLKLYPLHGLSDAFRPVLPNEKVFFETYQGYLSTQLGPQASDAELKTLQNQLVL
jgi:diadenosine tetraphosphate (Ap4A) HIT family hydrolase